MKPSIRVIMVTVDLRLSQVLLPSLLDTGARNLPTDSPLCHKGIQTARRCPIHESRRGSFADSCEAPWLPSICCPHRPLAYCHGFWSSNGQYLRRLFIYHKHLSQLIRRLRGCTTQISHYMETVKRLAHYSTQVYAFTAIETFGWVDAKEVRSISEVIRS